MILLVKLLIAHIIDDFVLQSDSSIKDKEKKGWKSTALYLHVLAHGILSWLLIWSLGFFGGLTIIVITHYIIDLWKLQYQNEENIRQMFIIDQIMHVVV